MKTIPESRVCRICKNEKPISEFYEHMGTWDYYCKTCKIERQKGNGKNRFDPTEPSSNYAMEILHQQGIIVAAGKQSNHRYLDLIAWGCVKIEVKYAKESDHEFQFMITKKQSANGLTADLVFFICEYENGDITYHLLPVNHPVITRSIKEHRRAIIYTPYHKKHIKINSGKTMLTKSIMNYYQDAWGLIEMVRQNYIKQLQGAEPIELPIPRQLELI